MANMQSLRDWDAIRRKIGPLRYQSSESDCVPTAIVNGLLFLLRRRLHPRLLQMIWSVSLETRAGTGYTSCHTLSTILQNWFSFAHEDGFEQEEMPFISTVVEGESVHLSRNNPLTRTLNYDGIAFLVTNDGAHYVLLHTHKRGNYFGFDPYYKVRKGAKSQNAIYDDCSGLANVRFTRGELEKLFKVDSNKWLHLVEPVEFH